MCELIATTTTCYLGKIEPFLADVQSAFVWGGILALLVGLVLMFFKADV